jgi:hypothetical protein
LCRGGEPTQTIGRSGFAGRRGCSGGAFVL